jgi:phosphatidylglycerophosphate synthase
VSARVSGKIKAWVQGVSSITIVCLVILNYWIAGIDVKTISFVLMTVTTVVTAYSGVDYFVGNLPAISRKD